MRRIKLSGEEANLVFNALDSGDPQRGLGLSDIRSLIPILDKLEAKAKKTPVPGGERFEFPCELEISLKESEFTLVQTKLESSTGWANVSVGRKVVALVDRIKETPSHAEPDTAEKKTS